MNQQQSPGDNQPSSPEPGIRQEADNSTFGSGQQAAIGNDNIQIQYNKNSFIIVINSQETTISETTFKEILEFDEEKLNFLSKNHPHIYVIIAYTLTYLKTFGALAEKNCWLNKRLKKQNVKADFKPLFNQLESLGTLTINEILVNKVLEDFSKSDLAVILRQELVKYLENQEIESHTSEIIAKWVTWETYPYIKEKFLSKLDNEITNWRLKIAQAEQSRMDGKYAKIESYLSTKISPNTSDLKIKQQWRLINAENEKYTIDNLYLGLKIHVLDTNKSLPESDKDLEEWVEEELMSKNENSQVIFIQAGPGRGKSTFCRIFADRVRMKFHPLWTPILIKLRDIDNFSSDIQNILSSALKEKFADAQNWLNEEDTRFLFILDGLDELYFENRKGNGVEDFLEKVVNYQKHSNCKHKFIVTGRNSALQGIKNYIYKNLKMAEIAVMDDELKKQWLEKWKILVGKDKAEGFQKFIKAGNCPESVKELAQEPLLLYLLAAMHRDNDLTIEMFKQASGTQSKILIYQNVIDWVLKKQRPEDLNTKITGLNNTELELILTEAGFCVTQSLREYVPIKTIEERFNHDETIIKKIEKARQNFKEGFSTALAAFYIRPAKDEGAVEFIHKSFGEFFCAKKIAQSFQTWVEVDSKNGHQEFIINNEALAKEIYDLLGYGKLSLEIVEYLIALLDKNKIQYLTLFQRFENFYKDWYLGNFINRDCEDSINLPLKQMQKFKKQNILLGLREVDIYAGLNVIILLLELHRYAQAQDKLKNNKDNIVFYPCGKEDSDNFDNQRLLRIINYSNSVTVNTFSATVGYFLSGANLTGAILTGANLERAKLGGANLERANLEGANLESANLESAILESAILERANLERAKLGGANLERANLESAILESAILERANLERAKLGGANLERANLESAILESAILERANLERAKLGGANLERANLESAILESAILERANLERAKLGGAILESAILESAILESAILERANLERAKLGGANLERANLIGANLTGANLTGANLTGAILRGAILRGAILEGANLRGANLESANLTGANLTGAYLESAYLESANLESANLTGAYLTGAYLTGANLESAILRGTNLTNANLRGANLTGANLESANLTDAYLESANLTGANLESANLTGAYLTGANLTDAKGLPKKIYE